MARQDGGVEHRQSPYLTSDGRTLEGVAVVYGDQANLGWAGERIEPGAFSPVPTDVILRMQHDRARPLARTGRGGLVLTDSAEALTYRATLPKTRDADDALEMVRSGILRGNSVEMRVKDADMDGTMRVVRKAALLGLSVVDIPAYKGSVLEARWDDLVSMSFPGAPTTERRRELWRLL